MSTNDDPGIPTDRTFLNFANLLTVLDEAQGRVKTKLAAIQSASDSISIADMFEMQMLMNKLAQFSEMSSSLVSASHSAIRSLVSGIKGQ